MSSHIVCEEIKSFYVDINKSLRPGALFGFMQQAAYEHAEILKVGYSHLNETKQLWVLSRLITEVKRYPLWGEKIKIITWPKGLRGLFALRDFEILDANEFPIINATTAWIIIDINTRRPIRDLEKVKAINTYPKLVIDEFPEKLDSFETEISRKFSADYSSVDLNGHVNNTKYVEWITDCLSEELHKKCFVKKMQVNFNLEMYWGEEIELFYKQIGTDSYAFNGLNKSKNANTFQAKVWLGNFNN